MILLKIHNSLEWVAMFRTKRKKEAIHYNADVFLQPYLNMYLCKWHHTLKYLELR